MKKLKIKSGDNVVVISGEHKGSTGKVLSIDIEKCRAIVENVNMVSIHRKPKTNSPQGGLIKKEAPIHISNLSLVDLKTNKPTRVGYEFRNGKKVRVSKKSKEII